MVRVYSVKPAGNRSHAFEVNVNGVRFDSLHSVSEYTDYIMCENTLVDRITETDTEYCSVREADGHTHEQGDGTIVGWCDRHTGNVTLECVYVD